MATRSHHFAKHPLRLVDAVSIVGQDDSEE